MASSRRWDASLDVGRLDYALLLAAPAPTALEAEAAAVDAADAADVADAADAARAKLIAASLYDASCSLA